MIDKFEVGKYYRYTGKVRPDGWNDHGKMDGVLDGQPHKCVKVISGSTTRAMFDGIPSKGWGDGCWGWADGIELWEEVSGVQAQDVIWNPDDPRVPALIGKQVYAFDSAQEYQIKTFFTGTLTRIASSLGESFPFRVSNEGYGGSGYKFIAPALEQETKTPYAEREAEWIAANGVKVGTRVKVVRKPTVEDGNGFALWYNAGMDGYIGQTMTVTDVKCGNGIKLDKLYLYPYFTLEVVKDVYRPYTSAEVRELVGKVVNRKSKSKTTMITEVDNYRISLNGYAVRPEDLLKNYEFTDGSVCGVKE